MIIDPQPGHLLVAPPGIQDPRFKKSVVYICANDENGTFGLIFNKPMNSAISDLIQLPNHPELNLKMPAYVGGPVAPHSVWMIHTPDWAMTNTKGITESVSFTSHAAMFHHLADGDAPDNFRVAFGYTGWAPTQLEREISGDPPWTPDGSWLVLEEYDDDWLWNAGDAELWEEATIQVGNKTVANWMA